MGFFQVFDHTGFELLARITHTVSPSMHEERPWSSLVTLTISLVFKGEDHLEFSFGLIHQMLDVLALGANFVFLAESVQHFPSVLQLQVFAHGSTLPWRVQSPHVMGVQAGGGSVTA